MDRELRIVRLLEPDLCLECRFAHIVEAVEHDGKKRQLIRCRRLDCDNWDVRSAEAVGMVMLSEES
ncbi:MAG: hypothetical protein KIS66_17710 [Fimbriimonadaceae bacterium]|nr:hypothetical protein [Fimbriimonadaceae bacterium]